MNDICSIELLTNAVANRLSSDEEAALYDHLARCEACCARMEQLVGVEQWQQEAASLLTTDELDAAVPETTVWSEVDFSVEHLDPSEDANVLGQLGGYDVLAIIGRGGMGVVLKAFDPELKRFVAIKALAPHLAHSSVARKRFAREAQAAAAVVNPHVIAIHHVQPTGRLPFLIMPLLTGESLAQRLKSRAPLELTEVLRIGMQSAVGLAAAHDQGLVHRDVKPANIFLEKGVERVVITDFGLARAADDVSMTRLGVVAGTPEYMSPEQARGEALDARSDLFSLGCVLYEMATGVSPFRSDSTIATLRRIVDDKPAVIASLAPELPPWFSYIVERLLSKDPAQRFSSASEVSQLLEACLSHLQQPTAVPLPASIALHANVRRSIFNSNIKGMLIMLGPLAMAMLGMVLWQVNEPPDISGQWTSDEWGAVVLEAKEPGQYQGTFTITDGDITSGKNSNAPAVSDNLAAPIETQSGNIQLKWSRVERRFNGTWGRGANRRGKISLRLVDDDIRGAWTTSKDIQKEFDSPQLADLLWTRSEGTIDATKINSSEWEMKQVFNPAHDQMVWAVAFAPDGKTIASAGNDQRIKIWDVASGSLSSTSFRPVNCTDVAYSPNGMYLAIAGGDYGINPPGEIVLWETADDEEEFVLESHESAQHSTSVAFSPDNRWLASGGIDKMVKIWSVQQRGLHKKLTGHTELVSQVAFSPSGKMLASSSFDKTVRLWSVPDGDAIATLHGHEKKVRGIAFSPDSKLLVSVGEDGTARLWNTSTGEQLGVMDGHGDRIFSVAFAPDAQHFATGSRGPSGVTIWDVNTRKGISPVVLPQQKREVMSLAFSSDGQMLAIVGSWNGFQIWKRKEVANLSGLAEPMDRRNVTARQIDSRDSKPAPSNP